MSADTLALLREGKLHGIRRLDLSAGLTSVPSEIHALADSLEILNLSDNQLTDLPDDLVQLPNLRIVFCSNNRFRHVPEVLGRCPRLEMIGFKANAVETLAPASLPPGLRWLVLTDNRLTKLPDEIGRCSRLRKLMLSGNLLEDLPASLARCEELELIRIAANRFRELPQFLFQLPRLAWIAFAGNPCSSEPASSAEPIDWDRLEIHELLGEGASGFIFKARWHPEDSVSPGDVAVKLFKGAVTSDGLPSHEIAACLSAGAHPNLLHALGVITGHPDGTEGLVMPLVPPDFRNLAHPPSLQSCSRDIYAEDRHFPLAVVLKIASGIASAAARLHSRGLNHGDLYAHNILWEPGGGCLLGDFGAASFYDGSTAAQPIEVRAFGILLSELLDRAAPVGTAIPETLAALRDRCVAPDVRGRPDFDEIVRILRESERASDS